MTLRSSLVFATATALLACGPSQGVLEDMDGGTRPERDGGPSVDGGPPVDTDSGITPDAGYEPDGGSSPPSCTNEWAPPADPTVGHWDPGFSMPGVGGVAAADALALAKGPDGTIYVGGYFSHAGSTPANNVAKYNPTTGWESLGDGIAGMVWSLAVHPAGLPVYASAEMEDTYETAVLLFDGTSWSELTRVDGLIHDMAVGADGALYVGGLFTGIGGDPALANFAVWDGTGWSGLGDGSPDAGVSAVLVDGSEICIGGRFGSIGTTSAQSVACWNGSEWNAYALSYASYDVKVLARDPDGVLIAGGDFPGDDGGSIARWTGTTWETIGGGLHGSAGPAEVEGIAFVGTDMYVAGHIVAAGPTESAVLVADVARWDGTSWHDVGGGAHRDRGIGLITQNVRRVVAVGGLVYISGMFTAVGTQSAGHIAAWDGNYWSSLRGPGQLDGAVNGTVNAIAARGDCGVYIGGLFNYAGNIVANNVAHFDGSRWNPLGAGLEGSISALAVAPDGTLYAGGDFIGPGFYYLAKWDGTAWSAVGGNVMGPVSSLAVDDDGNLYVSGDFSVAGDVSVNRIAMFDGSTWHALGDGLDRPASVIAFSPEGDVIVGGEFEHAGGAPAAHIARWDGSAWSTYGEGLPGFGSVSNIAFYRGQLVVSGMWDALDDGGRGVAVWDGTSWSSLGGGLFSAYPWSPPLVRGLAVVGDYLFAVGTFAVTPADEDDPHAVGTNVNAAYFDGSSWRGMGAGLDDIGEAILATETGVWFGGAFTKADTTPSVGIALWRFDR